MIDNNNSVCSNDKAIALLFHDRGTRRGEWTATRSGRTLPPGKTRYPFYRTLGVPQGRSGQVRKNLVHTGIRSRIVQPVAQSLCRLSYRAHRRDKRDKKLFHSDPSNTATCFTDSWRRVSVLTETCSIHDAVKKTWLYLTDLWRIVSKLLQAQRNVLYKIK